MEAVGLALANGDGMGWNGRKSFSGAPGEVLYLVRQLLLNVRSLP